MQYSATFVFNLELSHLLTAGHTAGRVVYHFHDSPAVKDSIEALGIPHTEIRNIIVNGQLAGFSYQLRPDDQIQVYGYADATAYPPLTPAPKKFEFIADVHLGKLSRLLRLLGFDCLYNNQLSDIQVIESASAQQRIILTRSANLLKHKAVVQGYLIRSEVPERQAEEVIARYQLHDFLDPFKRCMVCNGELHKVDKENVAAQLPPKTRTYFNEFWQCERCHRTYWQGSHFDRMTTWVDQLKNANQ